MICREKKITKGFQLEEFCGIFFGCKEDHSIWIFHGIIKMLAQKSLDSWAI